MLGGVCPSTGRQRRRQWGCVGAGPCCVSQCEWEMPARSRELQALSLWGNIAQQKEIKLILKFTTVRITECTPGPNLIEITVTE